VESDENGLDKKNFISTSDVKRVTAELNSDKIEIENAVHGHEVDHVESNGADLQAVGVTNK
jgi:hypothetical protein